MRLCQSDGSRAEKCLYFSVGVCFLYVSSPTLLDSKPPLDNPSEPYVDDGGEYLESGAWSRARSEEVVQRGITPTRLRRCLILDTAEGSLALAHGVAHMEVCQVNHGGRVTRCFLLAHITLGYRQRRSKCLPYDARVQWTVSDIGLSDETRNALLGTAVHLRLTDVREARAKHGRAVWQCYQSVCGEPCNTVNGCLRPSGGTICSRLGEAQRSQAQVSWRNLNAEKVKCATEHASAISKIARSPAATENCK